MPKSVLIKHRKNIKLETVSFTVSFNKGVAVLPRMVLLFSHLLTAEQVADAQRLGISDFIYLPAQLQERWSNLSPEGEVPGDLLNELDQWLAGVCQAGDYVLVQGDYGLTFALVGRCIERELIPVYATTVRRAVESKDPGGGVLISRVFRHCQFREYKSFAQLSGI